MRVNIGYICRTMQHTLRKVFISVGRTVSTVHHGLLFSRVRPLCEGRYTGCRTSKNMAQSDVLRILEEFSTNKYYIEYNVYKINHISHGIVALHRLGADTERILKYVKWYGAKMEPASKWGCEPTQDETNTEANLTPSELANLLGKRESYYKLRNHYAALLKDTYSGRIRDLVAAEFPKMANGLHASAIHPLIQMGYGLDINSSVAVTEAMAHLHFSWFPHATLTSHNAPSHSAGVVSKDILEVLEDVRNDDYLYEFMINEAKDPDWMPWYKATFQNRIGILLAKQDGFEKIHRYASSILLPDWFNKDHMSMEMVLDLVEWILHKALVLYACAEKRNDFFLLHGVTATWGLRQVLSTYTDPLKAFESVEYILCVIMCTYLARDRPKIDLNFLQEPKLDALVMDELRQEALGLEVDEHVYKMVYVCLKLSEKHADASQQRLYKLACRVVMDFEFK